jgi:hypothetical protein
MNVASAANSQLQATNDGDLSHCVDPESHLRSGYTLGSI